MSQAFWSVSLQWRGRLNQFDRRFHSNAPDIAEIKRRQLINEVIQPVGGLPSELPDIDIPNLENSNSGSSKFLKIGSVFGLAIIIANLFFPIATGV